MDIAWPGARTPDPDAVAFTVERIAPSHFRVSGELDASSGARLERAVNAAEDVDGVLVLDAGELLFMDSSGLRSLIRLARTREEGIVVRHARSPVRRALWITGFGRDPTLGIRVEDDGDTPLHANTGSDFLRA
jgi:anti-anti-sigma factor